jgi:hypothetical protein
MPMVRKLVSGLLNGTFAKMMGIVVYQMRANYRAFASRLLSSG